MERLDALQCRAAGICHDNFPSLESRRYAAAVGLTSRLLDGEGRGDLQSFCPSFVTNIARRSSRLNDLSDPARASRLHNPVAFRSLDSIRRSWHAVISTIWDTLPANLRTTTGPSHRMAFCIEGPSAVLLLITVCCFVCIVVLGYTVKKKKVGLRCPYRRKQVPIGIRV